MATGRRLAATSAAPVHPTVAVTVCAAAETLAEDSLGHPVTLQNTRAFGGLRHHGETSPLWRAQEVRGGTACFDTA